jgi:hypothetical protein
MRPSPALAGALFVICGGVASGFSLLNAGPLAVEAQTLLAKQSVQHADVTVTASAVSVRPGEQLTLWADVTPKRSVHVYAAGAKDFTPVSLVLTPNPAIAAAKPRYPQPKLSASPGTADLVPAYHDAFRIALPITVRATAAPGETITIGGAVRYQACDDRLCYPVTAAPVTWQLHVATP